jgi:glycosyltransferase involved in cell wall biosynthesis
MPRFSVIVTFYNQRNFVETALDSALSQPKHLREVIVVDDGSNDGTYEVLNQYEESVRLLKFPQNRGAIAARNSGASMAVGEYLVFLDGDDALMPWALDVYERLVQERGPTIILGRTLWCDHTFPSLANASTPENVEFIEYSTLMLKDRSVGLSASSYVVTRQAFNDVGGWSPGIFHLDLQDLSTKLGYSGPLVLVCSPQTAFYRIHSANTILRVPPFLDALHQLLAKERSGQYPGGRRHRFQRYAWFGGLVMFWVRRARRAGLYKEAFQLTACAWPMILASVIRRSIVRIKRRRPIETLALSSGKIGDDLAFG